MPEQFGDVLDRLDIQFTDLEGAGNPIQRLREVLGFEPTVEQVAAAAAHLIPQSIEAERQGIKHIMVNLPQGRVPQLRDLRGRIITQGRANVKRVLEERGIIF